MAFVARTFDQILEDMVAYVEANTILSDFTVGSVIRTILEAVALEDDEQYFQMTQVLEAFRFTSAIDDDLDRRLADFGLFRREATTAVSRVRFFTTNLITDQAGLAESSGSSSLTLFDSSKFPNTGFPYTVRVGEGTVRIQDLAVTANNTLTNTLTFSTTLNNNILIGDRVSMVTGSSSHTISTGTVVQAAPTVAEPARLYSTQEPAFIVQGNFFSNEVLVKSQQSGILGNVSAQRISQFLSGPPFPGAGVINFVQASGGSEREKDSEFRKRALEQLQSLSRGTPLALRTAAIGVTDSATGQRTVSANIVEDFSNDEVIVYIDDGTGLIPDTISLSSSVLDTGGGALAIGSSAVVVDNSADFPSSGTILIEDDLSSNPAELLEYVSKNDSTNTLILSGLTAIPHDDGTVVVLVDVITTAAESGRRRFSLRNFPVVRGTDRVFENSGSSWVELDPQDDYVLNKGTGEFQLSDVGGASLGAQYVAHYTYYTNLIAATQLVLEGDLDSPIVLPGVKAAGIFLSVEAPNIRRITVILSIVADFGFREDDLIPLVTQQIETYVSSLKIGEDVVRSKLIDVAFNVRGVKDVSIQIPVSNVTILENELPLPFDSDGNSLVTVL